MDNNELRLRALNFERPERIPMAAYFLPAAWMKYREALDEIIARHPLLFGHQGKNPDYDAVGGTYVTGEHIDAWGCVLSNLQMGMDSIVTGHPLKRREDINTLKAPTRDIGLPHGFMFLRLTDLRGFEEMMMDFADEPPELQKLINIVADYNVHQAHLLVEKLGANPQILYLGDDLGMQTSLPISPRKWRKYLKPAYMRIYRPLLDAGHTIYMHTDGHILDIIPDLMDCGVRIINPQSRANGMHALAAVCKGKVCVDIDLDRQLFPFATPQEIDAHVREAVEELGSPEGGLWLKAEMNFETSLENIEAVCAAMEKYTWYYS